MASSRVMASSSSPNSDLARQSSISSLAIAELQSSVSGDPAKSLGSMNLEDLLNIYGEGSAPAPFAGGVGGSNGGGAGEASVSRQGSVSMPKDIGGRTVEEMWREISAVRKAEGGEYGLEVGGMTLEDYLARTGGVTEEVFMSDPVTEPQLPPEIPVQLFGNGVDGGGGGGRGGRGRKRPLLDRADRAVLQRQKRMIKNRESAARSRERKQAYTVELESLVTQLVEDNAQLLRHQEEQNRKRLKQLMENVIPITQKKRPPRLLRRTRSLQW